MNTIEHITHEPGQPDEWVCICGNRPIDAGFHPCDQTGKIIEPDLGLWKNLYICDNCGRIIRQQTLEVVEQTTPNWELYA